MNNEKDCGIFFYSISKGIFITGRLSYGQRFLHRTFDKTKSFLCLTPIRNEWNVAFVTLFNIAMQENEAT